MSVPVGSTVSDSDGSSWYLCLFQAFKILFWELTLVTCAQCATKWFGTWAAVQGMWRRNILVLPETRLSKGMVDLCSVDTDSSFNKCVFRKIKVSNITFLLFQGSRTLWSEKRAWKVVSYVQFVQQTSPCNPIVGVMWKKNILGLINCLAHFATSPFWNVISKDTFQPVRGLPWQWLIHAKVCWKWLHMSSV